MPRPGPGPGDDIGQGIADDKAEDHGHAGHAEGIQDNPQNRGLEESAVVGQGQDRNHGDDRSPLQKTDDEQ